MANEASSEVRAWTKEPWRVVYGSDNDTGNYPADIIGPTGHPIACVLRPDPAADGADYASNARRIVACVNVCEGIPTADLLAQPTVAESVPLIGELVDAATAAAEYLCDEVIVPDHLPQDDPAQIIWARLRAAIAAMKGTVQQS